jgi:hypothetical protein
VTLEQNESWVRHFVQEPLHEGEFAAWDELVAPDFADHGAPHNQAPGSEDVERTLVHLPVVTGDVLAEGNRIVARLRAEAIHAGPSRGFPLARQLSQSPCLGASA